MFNLHNFIQFLSTNILQDWKSRSQKHALKFKLDYISLQLEPCAYIQYRQSHCSSYT